jgi:predicted RND superfamily exporter protein
VAIVVLFGLMGVLGISLDIATALLSSIMIGVGIDYTIHFLWRFKVERARGLDHKEAARETLSTTGRGIFFNAFSVIIGFLALAISNFEPMRMFSALVVISITTCLISALLLVPAIVILTKPRFLEPD